MNKLRKIRLFVAVPSTSTWESEFGMSLLFFTNYLASARKGENFIIDDFSIHNKKGSILANLRQWAVEDALKEGWTHLLFLDSDQTFPKDVAHRLLQHKKHIVAANIATKMIPAMPTARNEGGEAGVPVYTMQDSTGIEEVWRIGTGIMLIDLNVFKRNGMGNHWFDQPWNERLSAYNGEDWSFCKKLQECGVKFYIDHDLSKKVGHVGTLNYGHELCIKEEELHAVNS